MIRIVSRQALPKHQEVIIRIAAVAAAIAASMCIMALIGYNPFSVFGKILTGSVGTAYRLRETINKALLLIMLSLGTCIAFKMKFCNIGAEGQFYMGAFGAALTAFGCRQLPAPLLLTMMAIASCVCGGLWALIPANLKIKFGTSETLVTLMLNYVAQKWIGYLQYGPWRDPTGKGFPRMEKFTANAVLPKVFGVHIGWIAVIIFAALLYVMFRKTKFGYEISAIGESRTTSLYAGINVTRVTVIAIFMSGALCGLGGMMQASAIENTLSDNISGGLGFTAVITTWLGQLDPFIIVIVSFLFSMLIQGGTFLQSSLQIPSSMTMILQGIIIFFVLGSEFFVRYRLIRTKAQSRQKTEAV